MLTDDAKIKKEIAQAASDHLQAPDARTALNHFCRDVIAVSNENIYSSLAALTKDVNDYYQILKKVNNSGWDDIHIQILNSDTVTFTAKFNYSFTTIEDEIIDLKGIWTAIFVRETVSGKSNCVMNLFHNYS